MSEKDRSELAALREEVVKLREAIERRPPVPVVTWPQPWPYWQYVPYANPHPYTYTYGYCNGDTTTTASSGNIANVTWTMLGG